MNPFEPAGIWFLLFALVGLGRLLNQNRVAGFLMACVWLGPVVIGIFSFLLEKLPTVPYPRTFFYRQPFFIILGVMGAQEIGVGFLKLIRRNPDFLGKDLGALVVILAGVLILISSAHFFQHIYPQRISREPLGRMHDFVKILSPNDLLLVSNKMHVKFFLYGAHEMRIRVGKILQDEKIENIIFLDYEENNLPSSQEPKLRKKIPGLSHIDW